MTYTFKKKINLIIQFKYKALTILTKYANAYLKKKNPTELELHLGAVVADVPLSTHTNTHKISENDIINSLTDFDELARSYITIARKAQYA